MAKFEGPEFVQGGGLNIAIGATTVEQTGIVPGATYMFVARLGAACVAWGADDATVADGGFDFAVPVDGVVFAQAPEGITAVNVIEAEDGSDADAVLLVARVAD